MNDIAYLWFRFFWELYLGYREKHVYRTSLRQELPDEVKQIFDEESFSRARAYSSARVDLLEMKALYETVLNTGLAVFHGVQLFWDNSEAVVRWAGVSPSDAVASCVFVLTMNVLNTLAWLPLEVYAHFVLEEEHGFNRLTPGYFLKDKLKGFLLSQLVALCFTFLVVNIMLEGGDCFYLHLWVFLLLVFFFVNSVYPDFVAPMFDTFSPLPGGELKNKIQTLTASVDFPVSRVYVFESSKRTDHSDAYHVGLYKSKRIVLFDSLLRGHRGRGSTDRGLDHEEVLGVVGHELGHWNHNHILKLTAVSLLLCLLMLIAYGPTMKEKFLQKHFDFGDVRPLFVLDYLLPTRVALFSVGLLWVSRSFECQADGFAGSLGLAPRLRTALIKVHRDNLLFPVHDWLYAVSYHHHPSLLDRLEALNKYN